MLFRHFTWMGLFGWVAATALGCVSTNTAADAGMDAADTSRSDAFERDAAWSIPDVHLDAFSPDADLDAYRPDANETICHYVDYGSTCHMPCSQPPEERFTASVHWDSAYCCTFIHGPYETFEGCRCTDGFVECPIGPLWDDPRSLCEFCPGTPSGSVGDAGRRF